ncbi:MAG: prepilin-type N-terminal cleavage/methylation domain-containing protein [Candidatus Omnitrophota bacterium]
MMRNSRGMTLVEVLVALVLTLILFSSLLASILTIRSLSALTRHKMQATQVVRGQMEALKITAFDDIDDSSVAAPYDAGEDGVFGTADDLQGTLSVTVQDFLDMDGDGDAAETAIDLDGDAVNDTAFAKPVRVTFTWTQFVVGQSQVYSVSADTLIAA